MEQTPNPLILHASYACLMDAGSHRILYSKNTDKKVPMASTTKIMTALLVMEAIDQGKLSLTDQLTASHTAMTTGLAEDGSPGCQKSILVCSLEDSII